MLRPILLQRVEERYLCADFRIARRSCLICEDCNTVNRSDRGMVERLTALSVLGGPWKRLARIAHLDERLSSSRSKSESAPLVFLSNSSCIRSSNVFDSESTPPTAERGRVTVTDSLTLAILILYRGGCGAARHFRREEGEIMTRQPRRSCYDRLDAGGSARAGDLPVKGFMSIPKSLIRNASGRTFSFFTPIASTIHFRTTCMT